MDFPKSDPSSNLHNDKFHDGDPSQGIPRSIDKAAHMNAVYDEIINVIVGGGLTPSEGTVNQLLSAIQALTPYASIAETQNSAVANKAVTPNGLASWVIDGLTSTSTQRALTANQGRILKALVDSKVSTSTLHVNGGSTSQDPNVTTEPHILTNHVNSPSSSYFWHIDTQFYLTIDSNSNCRQIAVQYNAGSEMWVRSRYNGAWSGWHRVLTTNNEGSGGGIDADTVDGLQGSSLWHNGNDAHSNSANGYCKLPNGITLQWGSATVYGDSTTAVSFPIAFTAILQAYASYGTHVSGDGESVGAYSMSATGMTLSKATGPSGRVNWLAIGRI